MSAAPLSLAFSSCTILLLLYLQPNTFWFKCIYLNNVNDFFFEFSWCTGVSLVIYLTCPSLDGFLPATPTWASLCRPSLPPYKSIKPGLPSSVCQWVVCYVECSVSVCVKCFASCFSCLISPVFVFCTLRATPSCSLLFTFWYFSFIPPCPQGSIPCLYFVHKSPYLCIAVPCLPLQSLIAMFFFFPPFFLKKTPLMQFKLSRSHKDLDCTKKKLVKKNPTLTVFIKLYKDVGVMVFRIKVFISECVYTHSK